MRLSLSRRSDQEIVIGDPAAPLGLIRVGQVSRGVVRLTFDFPAATPVNRREIAEKILGSPLPAFGTLG